MPCCAQTLRGWGCITVELTVMLPAIVGQQRALDLLYAGREVRGLEASGLGLADRLVERPDLRSTADGFAADLGC
jgi:enoyl-CoA hydratase/carnithine racemase